jgi:formylglycine-generating enzyme required for sulfatase activity
MRWPELTQVKTFEVLSVAERLALAARIAAALDGYRAHPSLVGTSQLPAVRHGATNQLLVAIPGGTFTMGLRDDELAELKRGVFGDDPKQRFDHEFARWFGGSRVAHPVEVAPFLYATDVAQPDGSAKPDDGDEDPMYDEADAIQAFVDAIALHGFRLPSEAEWEWVAREGGVRSWIVDASGKHGLELDRGDAPANAWGISRLKSHHGELVADSWHPTYDGAPTDSRAWDPGMPNVQRGSNGCWQDEAEAFGCHAAWRTSGAAGCARVARDLP